MIIKIINRKNIFYLWTLIVFLLLAWPMPPGIGPDDNYSDKVVHFFLFGIFFSLLLFYLEEKKTCTNIKKYLYSFLLSCVYAGACELIQHFIPGRTASYYDFIAGVLGAFVFLLIIYGYERKR